MNSEESRQFVLDELIVVRAIPVAADRLAVLCHYQPAAAQGVYISQVLSVDHGGNWRDLGRFQWHGVDIARRVDGSLLVLGRDGQIGSVGSAEVGDGWLEKSRALGPMRGLTSFDDFVVAFGMNRNCYMLVGSSPWRRFEAGLDGNDEGDVDFDSLLDHMGGINSVALSRSGDQWVAVGMNGEIWRSPVAFDRWAREDSGTNVALTTAFVGTSGHESACGQAGLVLLNSGAGWRELPYSGTQRLDFTSGVADGESILLADGHSLRRLTDGVLEIVDMGTAQIVPCAKLSSGFGQIVGCAPKELFFSNCGNPWRLLL